MQLPPELGGQMAESPDQPPLPWHLVSGRYSNREHVQVAIHFVSPFAVRDAWSGLARPMLVSVDYAARVERRLVAASV
jgi:hypothetical protein